MSWLSSIFKKPKVTTAASLPPPSPVPTADMGDELDSFGLMRRAKKGRRQTILTGNSAPTGTQQRTLLG